MAKMGILTSLEKMWLQDIDISSIPSDNMAALSSVVTDCVCIDNVTGNIQTILANVKCRELVIRDVNLDHDETECLLEAMRNNMEEVWLYMNVSLDINALMSWANVGWCGASTMVLANVARWSAWSGDIMTFSPTGQGRWNGDGNMMNAVIHSLAFQEKRRTFSRKYL